MFHTVITMAVVSLAIHLSDIRREICEPRMHSYHAAAFVAAGGRRCEKGPFVWGESLSGNPPDGTC